MVISRIFPREPHYCVRNDATGPQGSESPSSLIPKGSRPVRSRERVGSTKTPDHKKEDLLFDPVQGTMAEDARRAKNGVLTSPRSVVPTQLFPPDQIPQIPTSLTPQTIFEGNLYDRKGDIHDEPLYDKDGLMVYAGREKTTFVASTENERKISTSPTSVVPPQFFSSDQTEISTASPANTTEFSTAPPEKTMKYLTAPPEDPEAPSTFTSTQYAIFEVDERKDSLTCHFLVDTEELSSKMLELQTKTDDDAIKFFWYKFWREWHEIGVILENKYPPEEMESLLSPWATWEDWTDDLFREDNEFLANLTAPPEDTTAVSEEPPEKTTEISTASPANTTEFSTAPPENKTEILTAASIETDGGTFTTEDLTAPPDISTASPANTTKILTATSKDTDNGIFTTADLTAPPENSTASSQKETASLVNLSMRGLLSDKSGKEAIGPTLNSSLAEEYFDREIINFQHEIDKVLSEDDEDEIFSAGRLSETVGSFLDDDGEVYNSGSILDGCKIYD